MALPTTKMEMTSGGGWLGETEARYSTEGEERAIAGRKSLQSEG